MPTGKIGERSQEEEVTEGLSKEDKEDKDLVKFSMFFFIYPECLLLLRIDLMLSDLKLINSVTTICPKASWAHMVSLYFLFVFLWCCA